MSLVPRLLWNVMSKGQLAPKHPISEYKCIRSIPYHEYEFFFSWSGVQRVVDLCAAPGSWSQVLSKRLKWVRIWTAYLTRNILATPSPSSLVATPTVALLYMPYKHAHFLLPVMQANRECRCENCCSGFAANGPHPWSDSDPWWYYQSEDGKVIHSLHMQWISMYIT